MGKSASKFCACNGALTQIFLVDLLKNSLTELCENASLVWGEGFKMPREVRMLIFSQSEAAEATSQSIDSIIAKLSDMPSDQLCKDLIAYCNRINIPLPKEGMKIATVGADTVTLSIELLQNRRENPD